MIIPLFRRSALFLCLTTAISATPAHHELSFVPSTLTRELIDSDGLKVTVKWTAISAEINSGKSEANYECEIVRDPGSNATLMLSLINLGVQGRDWDVKIVAATGKNLGFFDDNGDLLRDSAGNPMKKVNGAGKPVNVTVEAVQKNAGGAFDSKRLCFLQFDGGSCRFVVKSFRKLRKPMKPEKSEHDSVPPPPEPGGDDGAR